MTDILALMNTHSTSHAPVHLDVIPLQEEFTSYTVSGKMQLCWTIEEPDTGTVYTLSLDGAPAVTLRYDEANGYWAAARA